MILHREILKKSDSFSKSSAIHSDSMQSTENFEKLLEIELNKLNSVFVPGFKCPPTLWQLQSNPSVLAELF
jgi:hypothetical protein